MNFYIRFFNNEVLVNNVDEAIDFLRSIPEINVSPEMEEDVREFCKGDIMFPKRYKVSARQYFIIIKTEAATMQDFKDKKAVRTNEKDTKRKAANPILHLKTENPGWYEGKLSFKRVVTNQETGKNEYRDTVFVARVKAMSPFDCYERLVSHLSERVDPRSQFPSVKGKNFSYSYLGMWK